MPTVASAKKTLPPRFTPSKTNPVLHDIKDEDEGIEEEAAVPDESSRVLHVSKIYNRSDSNLLAMPAIAAIVCKMTKATQTPFNEPFHNLKG